MIYHGYIPIIAMCKGVEPIIGVAKGEDVVVVGNESNFITADGNMLVTADGYTFLAKEE